MLTTSANFQNLSRSSMRPIDYRVSMSFEKQFNDATNFFMIGTSLIGGPDFIKPTDSDVVQEWDKYQYTDLTDRVIGIEWEREVDPTASINMATAEVVLDNHDDYFVSGIQEVVTTVNEYNWGKTTPGSNSTSVSTDRKVVSPVVPTHTSILDKLVLRCRVTGLSTIGRACIYNNGAGVPANLIALSDQITISNTSMDWVEFTFTGAQKISINSGTTYWIGFHVKDPGATNFVFEHDSEVNQSCDSLAFDSYFNGTASAFGVFPLTTGPLACYIKCPETIVRTVISPISDYILPARPIRIYSGFDGELVQCFVGLTEKMPVIDKKAKTATFHCIDFMSTVLGRSLDESTLQQDKRTDEILTSLFNLAGITSLQLNLDVGLEVIPYAYFARGDTLGTAVKKLMEVEQGRIYMDELGVIQFKNRNNLTLTPVTSFNVYDNILEVNTRKEDDIYNVVEIRGNARIVQDNAQYWESGESFEIPPGGSIVIWADFEDPVTTVDDPIYEDIATTSFFAVNTVADGSGSDDPTNVTLTSTDQFAKAFKMTFHNAAGSARFITGITLFARAAAISQTIFVREKHDDSILKYEEQLLEIENDFFQTVDDAEDVAAHLIGSFGEYNDIFELDVKGSMALQLDDIVSIKLGNIHEDYKITKISCSIYQPINFKQTIKVRKFIAFS